MRKYSKWTSWSACPRVCDVECVTSVCVQVREKRCIIDSVCLGNVLKMERSCGLCARAKNTANTALLQSQTNSQLTVREQSTPPTVRLKDHCLTDDNFSEWNDWSQCLPACRRVRFRHCTSLRCMERVPYRDDPAVMEEEWCVPDSSELKCEDFLIKNLLDTEPPLPVEQCEKKRLKQQRHESGRQTAGDDREAKPGKLMVISLVES